MPLDTKPAKILLSPSFFYRFDPKQWRDQKPYPPYGTLIAAAQLRAVGFQVSLFDTHLRRSTGELLPVLEADPPRYLVIYDDGFNYLTKMCLTAMRQAAFELLKSGKSFHCQTIVCNSDANDHHTLYLENGADFVILGEGESTLLELIQALEKHQPVDEIKGIAYKQSSTAVTTNRRPVLTDLDALPDPAWDLVDINAYRHLWLKNHGYFSLNIATTRGCPFKCNWCAKPIYGNRYNSRSPERVVQEMSHLVNTYQVRHFWMADDIFGLKPHWVAEFKEAIVRSNLHIHYKIQSRADLLLKENQLENLVRSGMETVWIGAESGSQNILDAMDKGITLEQIAQSTQLLKSKGVKVGFFLQFGYLGETADDIQATLDLVSALNPDDIGVSISYPLPGTGFYEIVKHRLGPKQNWTDSDDLDMMYSGNYPAAFYKRLHRFVHKSFRLKQHGAHLAGATWKCFFTDSTLWMRLLAIIYYWPAQFIDRFILYGYSKKQFRVK